MTRNEERRTKNEERRTKNEDADADADADGRARGIAIPTCSGNITRSWWSIFDKMLLSMSSPGPK